MDGTMLPCDGCYGYFPRRRLSYRGEKIGLLCPECLEGWYETYGKDCPRCGRKTFRLCRPRLSPRTGERMCRRCAAALDAAEVAHVAAEIARLSRSAGSGGGGR